MDLSATRVPGSRAGGIAFPAGGRPVTLPPAKSAKSAPSTRHCITLTNVGKSKTCQTIIPFYRINTTPASTLASGDGPRGRIGMKDYFGYRGFVTGNRVASPRSIDGFRGVVDEAYRRDSPEGQGRTASLPRSAPGPKRGGLFPKFVGLAGRERHAGLGMASCPYHLSTRGARGPTGAISGVEPRAEASGRTRRPASRMVTELLSGMSSTS